MTKTPGSAGAQGKLAFLMVLLDVRVGERSLPCSHTGTNNCISSSEGTMFFGWRLVERVSHVSRQRPTHTQSSNMD